MGGDGGGGGALQAGGVGGGGGGEVILIPSPSWDHIPYPRLFEQTFTAIQEI